MSVRTQFQAPCALHFTRRTSTAVVPSQTNCCSQVRDCTERTLGKKSQRRSWIAHGLGRNGKNPLLFSTNKCHAPISAERNETTRRKHDACIKSTSSRTHPQLALVQDGLSDGEAHHIDQHARHQGHISAANGAAVCFPLCARREHLLRQPVIQRGNSCKLLFVSGGKGNR